MAKSYAGGIGILICCFPHMPFLFLKNFPTYAFFFFLSLPNFQCELISFDSIFICVFGKLLKPSS